jgi:hypothetical protein
MAKLTAGLDSAAGLQARGGTKGLVAGLAKTIADGDGGDDDNDDEGDGDDGDGDGSAGARGLAVGLAAYQESLKKSIAAPAAGLVPGLGTATIVRLEARAWAVPVFVLVPVPASISVAASVLVLVSAPILGLGAGLQYTEGLPAEHVTGFMTKLVALAGTSS